jgi:hypothetical protein
MIITARYVGPYPEVQAPGFENKLVKRDEVVRLRLKDGQPLGDCWEVVEDEKAGTADVATAGVDQANGTPDASAAELKKKGG